MDSPEFRSQPRQARVAFHFGVAYSLMVVFASLYPFADWRAPGVDLFSFITAPWPKYFSRSDFLINILCYSPLGFFFSLALLARVRSSLAIGMAVAWCVLLSFAMETVQMYLPMRVSSNLDLLANSLGGVAGAWLAVPARRSKLVGMHLAEFRERWIMPGGGGDLGLALLMLWFFTQINPSLPLMGNWIVDQGQPLQRFFSPHRFSLIEMGSVSLNVLALGIITSFLVKGGGRIVPTALVLSFAVLIKVLAALLLLQPAVFFVWASEESILGIVIGLSLLYFALGLAPRTRAVIAAGAIGLHLTALYLTPDVAAPSSEFFMFSWYFGQLLNLSGATLFFAKLWPVFAVLYLAVIYLTSPNRGKSSENEH